MGTQNRHNVPFLESASFKKKKRKALKRIKQIDKIFKNGNRKKKKCHLAPKVVIDLPFEEMKVEGIWKYRRRERVPKAGSRREETFPLICWFTAALLLWFTVQSDPILY